MLITPGLLTALAILILIMKLKGDTIKKLLGFDIYLDILVTTIMLVAFAGSYAGMMAAVIGGLTFSITLIALKKVMGYKRLTYVNDKDQVVPTLRWVDVAPIWRSKKDADLDEFIKQCEKENAE